MMRFSSVYGAGVITVVATSLSLALPMVEPGEEPSKDQSGLSGIGRSPVQRPARAREGDDGARDGGVRGAAAFPPEFRSITGFGNNLDDPTLGSAGIRLLRITMVDYADGSGEPAGADRESARVISNGCAAQDESILNRRGASDYLWQWGQFLDHDIDETPVTDPGEPFDIPVPPCDSWFDPNCKGDVTIPLDRSAYEVVKDVREQLNNITAFVDASNVYGSDAARAAELRTLDGTGRLKTSAGNLLPFNVNGFDNAPNANDPSFFLAGDVRANEHVGLTAMHTLFMREHNYWADSIRQVTPSLPGDEVYERARSIVGAEMQVITYREFLPLLLGPDALPPYDGYRPEVNASIANVFATAAYRFGHTMLSSLILRIDADGNEIEAGHLPLAGAFFNPDAIIEEGIEPILRGLGAQPAQEIDMYMIDAVRNFLFGPPGAGGFDLASLNIQRGRDHGLPSYNRVRVDFGLSPRAEFDEISSDPAVRAKLASMYDTVDDIDAWVGMLAEDHQSGGLVGETLFVILRNQFVRLRDGDRFWYQASLPPPFVHMVEKQTLAGIIRRNTPIGAELADDVFIASGALFEVICPGDPNDFQRFAGGAPTGDALDTCISDDVRLAVPNLRPFSPVLPYARVEIWAHTSLAPNAVASLDYLMEGGVTAIVPGGQNPDTLRTSIMNYASGAFEIVDQRATASAFVDETVSHAQSANAVDYVQAGDGEIRIRIDAWDPGAVLNADWELRVDQYEVMVSQ